VTIATIADDPIVVPFVVLIDGREKAPYRFDGLRADARQRRRPLVVRTEWAHLDTGDYTIERWENKIAVERKSLEDLYSTIGGHRERFKDELRRLDDMAVAAVVVEADWSTILESPPVWTRLPPKVIFRSVLSWQQRFPRVHWWFLPDRRRAEITTFRILERFWRGKDD
jgi:hypothetical protein